LISRYGIFVIETKNLKGWIFGGADQRKWTQTLYGQKHQFQNPLRQNFKHIKAIERTLSVRGNSIFSIVVFVGKSKFKTAMPHNVVVLKRLIPLLRSYTDIKFRDSDVEDLCLKLSEASKGVTYDKKAHIKNVKKNAKSPICPRCGKPMVLRKSRHGRKPGSKFWGCSAFPACRATKSVA
jgi:hypothetical protein